MAIVLDPLVSRLVDTLIGLANEGLISILGVSEEIEKLRGTLCSIQDVVDDAQQRQITEQGVKRWLSRLTDVMYDADDILDEYRITAEEWASQENPQEKLSLGSLTRPFFNVRQAKFKLKIGYKIRVLNKRLQKIWADKFNFDFRVSNRRRDCTRVGRQTSSGVEPDIVGEAIEKDTRDLVHLLMSKNEDTNANVVILAIVGTGGIGKTTLAQKIFQKIKAKFKKSMWVCVSQEFVETDLLREIIINAGGSLGEARSKEQLETKVKDVLMDNKFLLVLDDVWDAQIWEDWLRKPLQVGTVGSRVLVTTRIRRVAERMKAIRIHNVNPLPPHNSWLLLRKKATNNAEEERDIQSLKDIGMRIVEKCQGLPLAICAIGGVLCGKLSRWEWEQVERSLAWSRTGLPNGVHQALYLSYEDLPSHLKQCFLHCSLFREDSKLYKRNLVELWVAEGFVVEVAGEEHTSLEEIAEGYYGELVQRSLLQIFFGSYCKMHDLLRSLCHFLARGESLVIRDNNKHTADDDSIKLRRLSIVAPKFEDIKPFLHLTQRHKSVRTLILEDVETLDDKHVEDCFNNFQCLRVVHLGSTMIQSLPQSIGNLLHLRYLNLFGCIEVKELPESIAKLKYLQFLILKKCSNLRILPKGVVKLCNLRTLDLDEVPLEELPSGIAGLENLNVFKGAVFSSISWDSSSNSISCSLEEISQLHKLRELSIFNLRMTSAGSDPNLNGLNSPLAAFSNLVNLYLICGSHMFGSDQQVASYTEEETDRIEKLFDLALHPPSSVRHIKIFHFFGRQFPKWLMSSSISSLLPNLRILSLNGCQHCSLLPPLGKLPNLEILILNNLDAVTRIGAEFFGYDEASTSDGLGCESGGSNNASSSLPLFPHLKQLGLTSLNNLEEWHWVPEDGGTVAMPRLNELEVERCPKLLSLPEGLNRQATRLTALYIDESNINSISGFPSVKNLGIRNETTLEIISDLPALEVLQVELNEEEGLSLPDWLVDSLQHLTSLQRLELLYVNQQLVSNRLQDDPDWPKIRHIPVVEISDCEGNYITYIKDSSIFETNII